MTSYDLKRNDGSSAVAHRLQGGVLGWLTSQMRMQLQELRFREQINQLQRLGDRELHDIGIDRADIGRAVRYGRAERARDE